MKNELEGSTFFLWHPLQDSKISEGATNSKKILLIQVFLRFNSYLTLKRIETQTS